MDITTRANELLQNGQTFCLATVLRSDIPNVVPGQKAIVLADGGMEGGFGHEQLNLALLKQAITAHKHNRRGVVEIQPGLRVFFDLISSESTLVVCGAGHIAVPLVRFARSIGFNVTVLDDREDFAQPARFPDSRVIAENFSAALQKMTLGPTTYVVIITRGHEHDADCLMEVLKKETAYVGLIGSRRRVRFVLEMLEKQGIAKKRLQEVFTPIGTPIGAESPEEIALSIIAELVCVRRKGSQQARALRGAVGIDP